MLQQIETSRLVRRSRQASVISPSSGFIWREIVKRRQETAVYRIRRNGLAVALRHRTADAANLEEVFIRRTFDIPSEVTSQLPIDRQIKALDLGGFIGLFGLALLSQFPDARITAVEPDPHNLRMHRQNIALNGRLAEWSVLHGAAGVALGTARFDVTGGMDSHVIDSGGVEVPVLDIFELAGDADILKIDVEGAEWPILDDPRFANLPAKGVFLEYHPPLTLEDVRVPLERAGFSIVKVEERPAAGELWAARKPLP